MKKKAMYDCDEVLLDFINPMNGYYNDLYGTNFKREDYGSFNLWETWKCSKMQAEKIVFDFFNSSYSTQIVPIEGAQEAVKILSKKYFSEIATSRPEFIQSETIRIVNKYYPNQFRNFYFTFQYPKGNGNRKERICSENNANYLFEDLLDNVLACSRVVDRAFIFDKPWNQQNNLPENVERVYSWKEIVEKIK
jgi:hypothetical protein